MTFREVELVIGRKLPASAYRHRPWWANEERGHSHAKAWLEAGYMTEQVDMAGKKLVFARANRSRGLGEETNAFVNTKSEPTTGAKRTGIHPLIGALKGTFTIEPGYDVTQPAMPEWADLIDKKYGPEKPK